MSLTLLTGVNLDDPASITDGEYYVENSDGLPKGQSAGIFNQVSRADTNVTVYAASLFVDNRDTGTTENGALKFGFNGNLKIQGEDTLTVAFDDVAGDRTFTWDAPTERYVLNAIAGREVRDQMRLKLTNSYGYTITGHGSFTMTVGTDVSNIGFSASGYGEAPTAGIDGQEYPVMLVQEFKGLLAYGDKELSTYERFIFPKEAVIGLNARSFTWFRRRPFTFLRDK